MTKHNGIPERFTDGVRFSDREQGLSFRNPPSNQMQTPNFLGGLVSSPSQKTSYRGTQFLSAVLDLAPGLRRQALESVEAEDFTTEPFRIVYKTMLEIPGLTTINGREALCLALQDQSVANGSMNGEFGRGVQLAILDIAVDQSTGDMAFPLAKSLREDRFRTETCAIFTRLAKEAKTAPLEGIQASLQKVYQPEIDLFVRIEHPHRRLKKVA